MENVHSVKYLGITITDNIDLGQHISEGSSTVTKTLGFLCRDLTSAPESNTTFEVANRTVVWLEQEYTSPIWNPYSKTQNSRIEKGQRKAARWTCRIL